MTLAERSTAAIRASLRGHVPTEEQWDAISHPLEPVHLVAGAGSGKTAVMAARIVWIVENHGFMPSQVLGLTFTNKAAGELLERVRGALDASAARRDEITVQTYNAFAAGVVRDHGLLIGIEPEAGLLSEAQQWQLVLSCLDQLPPFEAIELRTQASIVRATLSLASSIADHMITVTKVEDAADQLLATRGINEDIAQAARRRKELCRVVAAYQRAKLEVGRIDFGDQVTKAVEILESFAEVRESYRKRFPIVLLDEYQDTNVAQRRMIQALVGEAGAVTAVGDARQAIYAFRGATMYNLIGFAGHFPRGDASPYEARSLSENFRSGRKILEAANRVVEQIDPDRRPGKPLTPLEANAEGRVALGLFSDEASEATWIAEECERLHGDATVEGREPVTWRDIAVLVRSKSAMAPIISAFEFHDIPFEVVGLGGLLKTPEVLEIVSWLRCLETKPAANRWLARILLGPRFRIHPRDVALCAHWAAGQNWDLRVRLAGGDEAAARELEPGEVGFSLSDALGHLDEIEGLDPEAATRMAAFTERLERVRAKAAAPLLDLAQEIITVAGVLDALESSPSRTAQAAKQNVSNFLDHVAAFAPLEGEATLRSFLSYLDAAEDAEETLDATQPADQDSVKLMTVHAAKGLEFECVFVPKVAARKNDKGDYINSVFPNTRLSNPLTSHTELPYEVREDSSHLPSWSPEMKVRDFQKELTERVLEDERRLFYVALTRAKQRLHVTASWWYGRDKNERGPSLFWEELASLADEGLVDVVERAELPETNPVYLVLEDQREWPPKPRAALEDELWPEGFGRAADALVAGETTVEALLAALDPEERAAAEARMAAHGEALDLIAASMDGAEAPSMALPDIVSATSYVLVKKGKMDPIDLLRPLPQRPTRARRIGTEVHRMIEERTRGIAPFPEETELDEPSEVTEPGILWQLMSQWERSGFAHRDPARLPSGEPMIELPFAYRRNGVIVRGRIDAVYEMEGGGYEIVDFKTGRRFEVEEPDQLSLYAEALEATGLLPEGAPVKLTYAFLDGETPLSRAWR